MGAETEAVSNSIKMSTWVFRTDSRSLQQIQIGAADLVAAHSAATSAWGWVGGFAGIRHILANIIPSRTVQLPMCSAA